MTLNDLLNFYLNSKKILGPLPHIQGMFEIFKMP